MNHSTFTENFDQYLSSLKEGSTGNGWTYGGKTNDAFGSPGGSWEGQIGYKFQNTDNGNEYILRCLPSKNYIVLESFVTHRQVYNMNLENKSIFKSSQGKSTLLESYIMTVGKGRAKKADIQNGFAQLGIHSNIIAEIDDENPNWNQLVYSLIKWAQNREEVKKLLQEKHHSPKELAKEADNQEPDKKLPSYPLNQILFGPPGTGKTYNTINKALEIIGIDISEMSRSEITNEFKAKIKRGQIVFTTFHQSMSYEEFIEGIKPIEPEKEGDNIIYRVEPGLFKKLCIEASFDFARGNSKSSETAEALSFSAIYDKFIDVVEEETLKGKPYNLKTKSGSSVIIEAITAHRNIQIKHQNGARSYTVSKSRLTKLNSEIDNLDKVNNINDEFREIIGGSNSSAYWSVLNAINKFKSKAGNTPAPQNLSFEDKVDVVDKMSHEDYQSNDANNYVLIIDEINRGNVSQIFGELITLLEKDKRLGKDEALKTKLPYSKESFGIPPNLYVIGTMNTADRSVEALDTALRRRFSFTEMPPQPNLLSPKEMIVRLWNKNEYSQAEWDNKPFRQDADALYDLLGIDAEFEKYFHVAEKDLPYKWTIEHLKTIKESDFDGVNLESLLRIVNKRIERLLDRDHLIGHSYFISINSWSDLMDSFYSNVIPLLQEYFYGDYAKIGAVLGDGFIHAEEQSDETPFASGYEDVEPIHDEVYKIKDYRLKSDIDAFKAAINNLI